MAGGKPGSKRRRLISAWLGLLGGNVDFRRLWLASACNHFGMIGQQLILALLVFEITRSSAWVGAAVALYFLPLAVFGFLSGAIADRFDRRRLLRIIEFATACNLAGFAALIAVGLEALWLLMLFTLISGTLRALYQPVRTSYAYDLVGGEEIVSGLAMRKAKPNTKRGIAMVRQARLRKPPQGTVEGAEHAINRAMDSYRDTHPGTTLGQLLEALDSAYRAVESIIEDSGE